MLACRLALYSNRLDEARPCLRRMIAANPADRTAPALLAEAEYRARDYAAAAAAFSAASREAHAQRLRHFADGGPYRFAAFEGARSIPFVRLDPLPVVAVRVNGGPPLNFIIDTGGADTIIDPSVARDAGARTFGEQSGIFAGGASASVTVAAVERLSLGDLELRNVPVTILDTSRFAQVFGGLPISGVIGTGLLSQFRSTLDYPRQRLDLRVRNPRARPAEGHALPMWLMGDHFILVDGSINGQRQLAFVDTGLAGLGCTMPQSTFARLGIRVGEGGNAGVGGAGQVSTTAPFQATVALGSVSQSGVSCIFGPFPPQLETLGGTRIGLLVSHALLRPFAVTFDFDRMTMVLGR